MKLYKYIGLQSKEKEDRIKNIICNKEIYLSPFQELNDPFEGTFRFNKSISYQDSGKGEITLIINKDNAIEAKSNDRILCLTTEKASILMWAHYANSFNGVCLEFEMPMSPLVESVQYKQKFDNDGNFNPLVKSLEWEYEKEYRYISKNDDEYLAFTTLNISLTGIYFGVKTCPQVIKRIKSLTILPHYVASLCHDDECKVKFTKIADIKLDSSRFILTTFGI